MFRFTRIHALKTCNVATFPSPLQLLIQIMTRHVLTIEGHRHRSVGRYIKALTHALFSGGNPVQLLEYHTDREVADVIRDLAPHRATLLTGTRYEVMRVLAQHGLARIEDQEQDQ